MRDNSKTTEVQFQDLAEGAIFETGFCTYIKISPESAVRIWENSAIQTVVPYIYGATPVKHNPDIRLEVKVPVEREPTMRKKAVRFGELPLHTEFIWQKDRFVKNDPNEATQINGWYTPMNMYAETLVIVEVEE